MAIGKEIRTQIASIKNTQKITSAMKMVAASKMKKAQNRMELSRPYTDKITNIISHLTKSHAEYKHPYTKVREVKKVGYIVISSDRGLCGGLNSNLFRSLIKNISKHNDDNIGVEFCAIGKKSLSFLKGIRVNIVSTASDLGDTPHLSDILGSVKAMLDKFDAGEIDSLFVAYNTYVNTMVQNTTVKQLLPIATTQIDKKEDKQWDYIYEPDAKTVLDNLLVRYVESLVYQSIVENIACEQSARMVAMQSATDNAGDMVKNLQLIYNKARQAAITQEISEIVSGAAAV